MLARGVSQPGLWPGRRHGSPVPVTGRPQAASSDFLSDIVLGTESTGFVEDLVRLRAEAAADDLLHDLGGAAEPCRIPDGAKPPR